MSASRILFAAVYGAIGALFGFLVGYFLFRPLLSLSFLPGAFHAIAAWSPHVFTAILGACAVLGYLKAEK